MATAPVLTVQNARVSYGGHPALDGVTLDVAPGEVVALLGPSGSGKTTLLSAVAGFVGLDDGQISIGGRVVSHPGHAVPPEHRHAGVVFQSYALWPHLSALDTVAYPIQRRSVPWAEARQRAADLLERVGMAALAQRKPGQLSGGQQQRVGLARALAAEPGLFLLDEPTANLDTSLRASLQAEIRAQLQRTGAAALYVTHDHAEAFLVADRVAVLRDGRLAQIASPAEVYRAPADRWVASLTGGGSILSAVVNGLDRLMIAGTEVLCPLSFPSSVEMDGPTSVEIYLRPGWVRLDPPGAPGLHATLRAAHFQGYHTDYVLATAAGDVLVREPGPPRLEPGAEVSWTPTAAAVLGG